MEEERLKIVSFNCLNKKASKSYYTLEKCDICKTPGCKDNHYLPWNIDCKNLQIHRRKHRLNAYFIDIYNNYHGVDIFCLQEIDSLKTLQNITDELNEELSLSVEFRCSWYPRNIDHTDGLAFIYRSDIKVHEIIIKYYDNNNHIIVSYKFEKYCRLIWIINTQVNYETRIKDITDTLLPFVDSLSPSKCLKIITGDLNATKYESWYNDIFNINKKKRDIHDAYNVLPSKRPEFTFFTVKEDQKKVIDYFILMNITEYKCGIKRLECSDTKDIRYLPNETIPSDHIPIFIEFTLYIK
jgi:mRNA deadenylase 3'-5' endonuclease subunit Ccr4